MHVILVSLQTFQGTTPLLLTFSCSKFEMNTPTAFKRNFFQGYPKARNLTALDPAKYSRRNKQPQSLEESRHFTFDARAVMRSEVLYISRTQCFSTPVYYWEKDGRSCEKGLWNFASSLQFILEKSCAMQHQLSK